jgi:predicted solute-binding protein
MNSETTYHIIIFDFSHNSSIRIHNAAHTIQECERIAASNLMSETRYFQVVIYHFNADNTQVIDEFYDYDKVQQLQKQI